MSRRFRLALAAAAGLIACGSSLPALAAAADPDLASYYREVMSPPQGFSRVYILPRVTQTFYGEPEHSSDIYLGPDSAHAVFAGSVDAGQFLAFDVELGRTLYVKADPYGEIILHFAENAPVFLRPITRPVPSFPGGEATGWTDSDAKSLIAGQPNAVIAFDHLEPFAASQHIHGWRLSALTSEARAFVSQTLGKIPASAAPQGTPGANGAKSPSLSAIPSGTDASAAEADLIALKRFYENGLITRDEYDVKRREVLRALGRR